MKKSFLIIALVSASVLMIACNSKNAEEKAPVVETKPSIVGKEVVTEKNEPKKEIVYKDIAQVKDPVIETSSVLKDDSGFNYEGKNVVDRDLSTSWCGAKGIGDTVSFSFKDPVKASVVGMIPGFGANRSSYFENNRIKTLKIYFSIENEDGSSYKSDWVYNLTDAYSMFFVDFGDQQFKDVKFEILDVYPGSKYQDTCISEVDFWSDFVKNKDANGAVDYYNKDNIVSEVLVSDVAPDKCGTPVTPSESFKDENFGIAITHRDNLNASAVINQYGKVGDKLTAKWYGTYGPLGSETLNWKLMDTQNDVPVVADCNGKLYAIASSLEPKLGPYRVEFFNGEKSVGSASFFMPQ